MIRRLSIAFLFALAGLSLGYREIDRSPTWDCFNLVSFNRGDGSDASHQRATPTVGSGVNFSTVARAADFDGTSNAVISYADTAELDGVPLSVLAWIYIDTYTSYRSIVSKHTQSGTGDSYRGWHFYYGPGLSRGLSFGRTEHGTTKYRQYYSAIGTLAAGSWYHVAVTCADLNSAPSLYINGVSQSLSSITAGTVTTIATTEPVRIAGKGGPDAGWAYHDGRIDDVQIFTRELSASEIGAFYSKGRP